jgi:hypothetical protein
MSSQLAMLSSSCACEVVLPTVIRCPTPQHTSRRPWLHMNLSASCCLSAAALSAHFEKLTTQVKTQPGQPQEVRPDLPAAVGWQ